MGGRSGVQLQEDLLEVEIIDEHICMQPLPQVGEDGGRHPVNRQEGPRALHFGPQQAGHGEIGRQVG